MALIDFEFNNKRLSDFNCVLCHITDSAGDITEEVGVKSLNTARNSGTYEFDLASVDYSSPFTFTEQIGKFNCKDVNNYIFSDAEQRQIQRWLSPDHYCKLKPYYSDGSYADVVFYGVFDVFPLYQYGELVGFEIRFTANSSFGFGRKRNLQFSLAGTKNSFVITGDSDKEGFLYPNVVITCKKAGDLKIERNGEETEIKNCQKGETIVLRGKEKIIESSIEHNRLYNDFNYVFPVIESGVDNPKNKFTVSIPCDIKFEYEPIRKVGVVR